MPADVAIRDGKTLRRPLAAALSVAVLALAGCGDRQPTEPPAKPATGERFLVQERTIPDQKPLAATITTRDMAEARARIGGVLVRLAVREGEAVRRGQLIGRVVDQHIGLETGAYRAQAEAAQAQNERAQADLARIRDLYDHGVYARARLDQAEAAAKAAAAGVTAARAQAAASADVAGQGVILAPADGRVLHAQVPAGSVVTPGQSVATLTAGPTVLRVEVPEAEALALSAGQTATFSSEDLGRPTGEARIVQIYPDVIAGKANVDLAVAGLASELVGRRVGVKLALGVRKAVIVPRRFIVSRYGIDYARVVARNGSVADAPVQTTAGPVPGEVEILSGLAPGDVIAPPEIGR